MANKRNFKKMVRCVCGEIAGQCIYTQNFIDGIDGDKMDDIICDVAMLQVRTIDRVSVSFDRNMKSFSGNAREYRKAREIYFKKCYEGIKKEFMASLNEVVSRMNALIPQEVRDANKAAMKK